MLGGGRNGRQWKWGVAVLLFLSFVYVFYLYRGVRSVLQDKEDELESLDALQNRMGEQLQSLIKEHTALQEELKNERVAHHKTRIEKDKLEKQCQMDLKQLKKTEEEEKLKLEQERNQYKGQLEEASENYQRLQKQQDSLVSRYDHDMQDCVNEKKTIEEDCQDRQVEHDDAIKSFRSQVALAKTSEQRWEAVYAQCNTQVQKLEQTVEIKDSRIQSVEIEFLNCKQDMGTLTSEREQLQSDLDEARKSAQRVALTNQKIRTQPQGGLNQRGQNLVGLNQGVESFNDVPPRVEINPNQGQREVKRNVPPQFGLGADQRGQGHDPHPYPGNKQMPDDRNRGQFGNPGPNQRWPTQDGMEYGHAQPRDGMGMERDVAGVEKQQLPELAEQEEVRELQLEEQEPPQRDTDPRKQEEEDEGEREERGEEGDDGVGEQAFNPDDEEDEQGRRRVDGADEEEPPNDVHEKMPMPVPNRVIRENGDEGMEFEKFRPPPRFENPNRDFVEQQKFEEEMERQQRDIVNDNAAKNDAEKEDDDGWKQLEKDRHYDRYERAQRLIAKNQRGLGLNRADGKRDDPNWNQDAGGMVRGPAGDGNEVDEAMRHEIADNDLRKREFISDMERQRQEEVERKLQQQNQGQREHNLR